MTTPKPSPCKRCWGRGWIARRWLYSGVISDRAVHKSLDYGKQDCPNCQGS